MYWLALLVLSSPSWAIPYPVSEDTAFPGTGGCSRQFGMGPGPMGDQWVGCNSGGDYRANCVPTADGGYKCICSSAYQLYSDGVCKPRDPCGNTTSNYYYNYNNYDYLKQSCQSSGGVCKVDLSLPRGFTCDCSGLPGFYSDYLSSQCVSDPCTRYGSCTSWNGVNGVCTPRNADSTNLYPFSCQCQAPQLFLPNNTWFSGRCVSPCNTTDNPNLWNCDSCSVDTSSRLGYSCKCNSTSQIRLFDRCYDPCKENATFNGPPMPYMQSNIRANGTDLPSGDNACKLYDPNASCYTTEKSPLFYQCKCSAGFTSKFFYKGNSYDMAWYDVTNNIITCVKAEPCDIQSPCGTADPNAVCINSGTSYTCQCSPGFTLSGKTCVRIAATGCQNADKLDGNPCNNNGDKMATCTADCATSYTCKCSKGFWARDNTCVDSNECESSKNPCPDVGCGTKNDTICRNTVGSHTCTCGKGAICACGTPAVCTTRNDGLKKCKCGSDTYYYY